MSNLVFPMFTKVSQNDGVEDKQLCWESYHKTPDGLISKQSSKVYGESVVAMVLPFSNRVQVVERRAQGEDCVLYEATFLQFGSEYEEFDNGIGNLTVAVLLKDDGQIVTTPVWQVKFIQTTKEAS
ncbi:hypothetical protein AAEJ42_02215 [Shewanella algae]|uniref:hypothetical protein n=1 Tax=Shewanella algae TaxID=38313 RepID=UPI001AAE09F0|nr:hypothetical protein [Shewanella algae]MBO2552628.1 hypothetical protein [Shewanella algae]BCV49598.1 hypothetical protein TUM17382_22910 [Shewanella algae]